MVNYPPPPTPWVPNVSVSRQVGRSAVCKSAVCVCRTPRLKLVSVPFTRLLLDMVTFRKVFRRASCIWSAICLKLWHDIRLYVRFFPTYTCNHSWYTIYVRFFATYTYTCVLSRFVGFFFPSIWPFSCKRAYICAQKSSYICGQVIHGSLHIDSLICYLLYLVYHYISYVYPCLP